MPVFDLPFLSGYTVTCHVHVTACELLLNVSLCCKQELVFDKIVFISPSRMELPFSYTGSKELFLKCTSQNCDKYRPRTHFVIQTPIGIPLKFTSNHLGLDFGIGERSKVCEMVIEVLSLVSHYTDTCACMEYVWVCLRE